MTLADASQAPDTKVLKSGARESDMTSPVWPVKEVHYKKITNKRISTYTPALIHLYIMLFDLHNMK